MAHLRSAICPCCKFATLTERGIYEICVICWWEDDGQDDSDADDVRGGPNGHHSLAGAQKNFARHGHMYDKGTGIPAVENPSPSRSALLHYLTSIGFVPMRADPNGLGLLLDAEDQHLRSLSR